MYISILGLAYLGCVVIRKLYAKRQYEKNKESMLYLLRRWTL